MGRVLRIVTRLNRGGPLRQLCALVPGLEAHGWRGPVLHGRCDAHEPDGTRDLEAAGAWLIPIEALQRGIHPREDWRALRAVIDATRKFEPDLIHTHMGKAGALGRFVGRMTRTPVVHTFHGHHFDISALKSSAARFAERRLGTWTAGAICLSKRQYDDVATRHDVLPPERVHVIEPGFDIASFRAGAAGVERPQGGPARLVWTGRFVEVKDPWTLLAAMERTSTPCELTMLGDGPLLDAVRAAVRQRALEDRVSVPGAVDDVAPHVAAADMLVLSSRSEGTPISVLEAMALGVPPVVTAVGGLPDIVAHEETGLCVPPNDPAALASAIDRLASDPELRARIGAKAAGVAARRFAPERLAAETAALYERLLVSAR